jgi:hypothetical protein
VPNPPKPTERKRAIGTLRPDRMPVRGNLAAVPAMDRHPSELSPKDAFEVVLAEAVGWLAATDAPIVALLRHSLEEREKLRGAVRHGHGKRTEHRELDESIVSMLSLIGFSPADGARLGLAEVKAASKMEELRAKRRK